MMIKRFLGVLSCIGVLALSGCATNKDNDESNKNAYNKELRHQIPVKYNAKVFSKFAENTKALDDDEFLAQIDKDQTNKIFYFDFDQSKVDPLNQKRLTQLASYLLEHPEWKVKIDGHTDERGSREYNVGLGERRAKSVSEILMAQGVKRNQLALVSYGKERPAVQGHNENSWQKNRRAEIEFDVG